MMRTIFDSARNAAMNMAIDELLFDGLKEGAILRLYSWDGAYTTIGYFQKNSSNAVRRLTGGLLVNHKSDISYGFCADAQSWPYVYSQQDTYKYIHTAVKNALSAVGYDCNFVKAEKKTGENVLCVQTLYSDDLIFYDRKVVGSCMRRRGKKILVQGSIHLDLDTTKKEKFYREFSENMASLMKTTAKEESLSNAELKKALELSFKYSSVQWNNKY